MKKILFLFVIITCVSFISCSGNQENPPGDTGKSPSLHADEANEDTPTIDLYSTDYLPEKDYGGADLTILAYGDYISGANMFMAEAQTGETINDAIYQRNRTVEGRFNINIKCIEFGWGETSVALQKTVNAGDHAYDLLALHSIEGCGPMLTKNLVYNWLDVPYVNSNLDKSWYNQSIRELLEINGFLPFIASDFNYGSYPFTFAMIFNKSFVRNYQIENPYDLVKSGNWTLDKFREMVKMFSEDINGDGIYDENDLYGLCTDNFLHPVAFVYAMGNTFVNKTKDNELELTLYNEKSVRLVETLYDIIYVGNNTYRFDYANSLDTVIPIDQNRTFIQSLWLYDLPAMRSMEVDFGIIPYPKYDKQQGKYYTYADARGSVLALPVNSPDVEKIGVIVEALSAESKRYVVPAYYDIALTQKDIRDEESREMLDIIFAGRVYDIGYMFDSGLAWSISILLNEKKSDLTSSYEKNEAKYKKYYDGILKTYQDAVQD